MWSNTTTRRDSHEHEGHGSGVKITLAAIFQQMFLAIISIVTISNSLRWTNCKISFLKKKKQSQFHGALSRFASQAVCTCAYDLSPPPPPSAFFLYFPSPTCQLVRSLFCVCVCQRVQIWLLNPALLISSLPPALLP